MTNNKTQSFYELTPDEVLNGVELQGVRSTGKYIQLNSYENRVFDIHLEENNIFDTNRVITKFYRPNRWSKNAILEEHSFLQELLDNGVKVIPPFKLKNGSTIDVHKNIFMTLFPKFWGRMPQELPAEELKKIGRSLARLHNIGQQKEAKHRPYLTVDSFGWPSLDVLEDWIFPDLKERYLTAAAEILDFLESELKPQNYLRIHGDCHKGNLLITDLKNHDDEYFFVDFDDFCNGPEVQDFWMLFSSNDEEESLQEEIESILSGYDELRQAPAKDLYLIPALRGLRIIHYSAWIARRWADPSFPNLFPNFKSFNSWAEEVESLEKVCAKI